MNSQPCTTIHPPTAPAASQINSYMLEQAQATCTHIQCLSPPYDVDSKAPSLPTVCLAKRFFVKVHQSPHQSHHTFRTSW